MGRTSKRANLRRVDSGLVKRIAKKIEAQLLQHRRGGIGVDLPEDQADPSRTDPIVALAVEQLLKKYGNQLVLSRFRGNVQLSWRASAFAQVNKERREELEKVGFYDMPVDAADVGAINPHGVLDPRTPEGAKQVQEQREARVKAWQEKGWKGVMLPDGTFYVPPEADKEMQRARFEAENEARKAAKMEPLPYPEALK